ncbi:MAG: DUF4123 domain-containing protein [Marinobacter sp.]|nr:DUF4123 domain-containing protein [Marinobacter sp.]
MIEYVPREWLDSTDEKLNFFVIAELAFIEPTERAVTLDQVSGRMWPLVYDDTQLHLVSEGPWLIQLDLNRLKQASISSLAGACQAWIVAYSEGEHLSRQLAPALCCISPEQEVRLLRFYCPEIIKILKDQVECSWFDELFANLVSWNYKLEYGEFRTIFEFPLTTKSDNSDGWTLEVDGDLWRELVGNPEIDALISSLTKETPEVFCGLSGVMKRQRVQDCLNRADDLGIVAVDDRRVYVYLAMAAGNEETASAEVKELAERAVSMNKPLVDLLDGLVEQGSI